jgi:4-amino-4-deoxy-L-arabinose transferase-like glycosyltransferase
LRNGPVFFSDFILKHNVERFVSSAALGHGRPIWYYLEILPALLLPWTALLPLLTPPSLYREPRRAFLLAWAVWILVVFSLAANKLPGYILPALPALSTLFGLALDEESKAARVWLPAAALLLIAFPIAAAVLPAAIAVGLTHAPPPAFQWVWLLPAGVAILAWIAEARGKRLAAVFCVALGATAGTVYLKRTAGPELDRLATTRTLWNQIAGRQNDVCIESLERNWRYGLNYYSVEPLPDCNRQGKPLRIVQPPGAPPRLVRAVDRGVAIIVKSRI